MAPKTDQLLRRQISEAFRKSSERIDREVAEALSNNGEFRFHFTSSDLSIVFANILHTLVDLQKFVGVSVPLIHNVAQIDVEVRHPRIMVASVLHVHSPIKAFIDINYVLSNHPVTPGVLTLVKNSLRVDEKTGRFDVIAKAALSAIDIGGLVERELQDPAQVIRQTLPHRLKVYGFHGKIHTVQVEVTPDHCLDTLLKS